MRAPQVTTKTRLAPFLAATAVALVAAGAGGSAFPTSPKGLVFPHGGGRGQVGAGASTDPMFLSEADARTAIDAVLVEGGFRVRPDGLVLKRLVTRRQAVRREGVPPERALGSEDLVVPNQDLTMDGYDASAKVGYEFVAREDYADVGGVDAAQGVLLRANGTRVTFLSSIHGYDYLDAAEHLAAAIDALPARGAMALAVFYDPLVVTVPVLGARGVDHAATAVATKERALAQLRQQARDFVRWLRERGVGTGKGATP